jgi:hypothetical protein
MKILVCGGRNFGHVVRTEALTKQESPETQERLQEYKYIQAVLHGYVMANSRERNDSDNWLPTDITIIEGGATGADSAAADFATVHYCQLEEYKADWKKHGTSAGPIRNRQMLEDGKPDIVLAFPGGKGTANMIAQARAYGIPVVEYKYEGGPAE